MLRPCAKRLAWLMLGTVYIGRCSPEGEPQQACHPGLQNKLAPKYSTSLLLAVPVDEMQGNMESRAQPLIPWHCPILPQLPGLLFQVVKVLRPLVSKLLVTQLAGFAFCDPLLLRDIFFLPLSLLNLLRQGLT